MKPKSSPESLPEAVDEFPPHEADAVTHADDLLSPQDAHVGRIPVIDVTIPRAVRRRVRIVRTDHAFQLAQHPCRLVFVRGDDAQWPRRVRPYREKDFENELATSMRGIAPANPADHLRVLFDPFPEALVCEIEERYQPARRKRA